MNTRNLMRKLPSCLLGAIFVVGVASTTVNAVDGDPPGLFELEGNTLEEGGVTGTDWEELYNLSLNVPPGPFPPNLITFTGITADPAPQTIYWKGGSKDINDVTEWWYKDGSVPDKDDITNAYAAAYTNPANICVDNGTDNEVECDAPAPADPVIRHAEGDLIVYFGLDRFANDGDAFAGFWFFQDAVATNGNNQFTGEHKPGDILVLVEYPQASGATPTIKVYEWDPVDADNDNVANNLDLLITELDADCDANDGISKLACAISNTSPLTNEPPWPYTPKSGSVDDLPFESFYEGGINVTQLLGSTPCFAAFLAETRASRSETATLKDFVIDEFPVCGAAVTKACGTVDINTAGTEATVNFHGIASNTGGQSVFVVLEDDPVATFTAVCFDNNHNNVCGDVGDAAVPATLGTTAEFALGAGQQVLYEGHYTKSGITGLEFSDTVSLDFFADDDGTKGVFLGSAEPASVTCFGDVTPLLKIVKECDPVDGGVHLAVEGTPPRVVVLVDNIITVTNTGTDPLINVTVSDSEVQSLDQFSGPNFPTCTDANGGDAQCTGGSLAPGEVAVFKQTYRPDTITGDPDLPGTVSFTNTATATGTGTLSGNAAGVDPLSVPTAECELCPD